MTPSELADIFDEWAAEADEKFRRAFDDDEIGRAARLRGRAQGFSIAAVEVRKALAGANADAGSDV